MVVRDYRARQSAGVRVRLATPDPAPFGTFDVASFDLNVKGTPDEEAVNVRFPIGARVVIQGFKNQAKFNGSWPFTGRICSLFREETGGCGVEIDQALCIGTSLVTKQV